MASSLTLTLAIVASTPAKADLRAIIIDPRKLPYDLSPEKYGNSPSTYANASTTYANSENTYSNSASTYSNSKSTYGNGIDGDRRLYDDDNNYLGYYVFSTEGVLNLYSTSGRRLAYVPNANTKSIFLSDGGWCGTIAEISGTTVAALTSNCHLRFKIE